METKYLVILAIAAIICFGVFFYQMNHDLETFIVFNTTEVHENGTVEGHLVDAFARGVPNKTITFHKPGYDLGTIVSVTTDENGAFTITNIEYLPECGENNYYGDFTFAGDSQYKGTTYEKNLTVIAN